MEISPEASIGTAVRKLRELKNLTQTDLAKKAGVSQQYISQVESDETDPSFSKVVAIAEGLGIKTSELLGVMDKTVNITIENSKSENGMQRYVNGPFTVTVQPTVPNEERELYKDMIAALKSENAALRTALNGVAQKA